MQNMHSAVFLCKKRRRALRGNDVNISKILEKFFALCYTL